MSLCKITQLVPISAVWEPTERGTTKRTISRTPFLQENERHSRSVLGEEYLKRSSELHNSENEVQPPTRLSITLSFAKQHLK